MKEILQGTERGRRVFLFLDYDGTLVPIRNTPEQALFPTPKRSFLKLLAKKAFVGIVSGRSLSEIQPLVAIKDIAYIGNHGLEISYGQRCWIHPDAKKTQPILREALRNIHLSTKDIPGILVENKGLTGAVHYRLADPAFGKTLNDIVKEEVEQIGRILKITEGKKVFEIKPDILWDKGKGVLELMGWLNPRERSRLIYIGDDQTDEDAFREINRSDRSSLTIHVGRAKKSKARYRLANIKEVWMFLRALLPLITECSGGEK
jgi:alpha,alpha-trehalase